MEDANDRMKWLKSFFKGAIMPEGSQFVEPSNFTPRAQQVLTLARKEADRYHHNFVGTEHLLLGIIKLGQGTAVNALATMGVDLEKVTSEVEKLIGPGPDQKMVGHIPYTPRVKKVLSLAAKEAKALNHTYVGTEHIPLGLLSEGDGVAARVLKNLGVDTEVTRSHVLKELDPNYSPEERLKGEKVQTEFHRDTIDISKRYDVYCKEGEQDVVYRNALLKGMTRLFKKTAYDACFEYVEIEQANGQTIFLARSSVVKFCEHGTTPGGEIISGGEICLNLNQTILHHELSKSSLLRARKRIV
jgi:hypothetical protein